MADAHKNLAKSLVATAPSPADSGTSLIVTTGHGTRFPTPPFNATIQQAGVDPDPTTAEIVRVTNIATDTLTIERAQEGTSARTVIVGDLIYTAITAKFLTDLENDVANRIVAPGTVTAGAVVIFDGTTGKLVSEGVTLGNCATKNVGNSANTICAGDDGRLSDNRTPVDHDHANNKLAQSATHESPDTDTATTALHHTLGNGANQAAAGDHNHNGVYLPAAGVAADVNPEGTNISGALGAKLDSNGNGASLTGLTKAQVGLTNVTDDAQTKASVVPNDAPSAGQVLVGNGSNVYAPVSMSGHATLANTGALTIAANVVTASMLSNSVAAVLAFQQILDTLNIAAYTDSANLANTDHSKLATLNHANAKVLTFLRDDVYVNPHPTGSSLVWFNLGAGQWTFSPQDANVSLLALGNALKTAGQNATGAFVKLGANTWAITGGLTNA